MPTTQAAPNRKRRQLELTAYHEAGHAVVAIELRRGFRYVTIEPEEGSLGHVKSDPFPKSFRPDLSLGWREERIIDREVTIDLAGLAAASHFVGRKFYRGTSGDFRNAIDLACRLYDGEVLERFIEFKIAHVCALVRSPLCWVQIEALAAALLERRRISGREARAICRDSLLSAAGVRRVEKLDRDWLRSEMEESERLIREIAEEDEQETQAG